MTDDQWKAAAAGLGLLYSGWEWWLGRTHTVKAASTWQLVYNALHGVYELVFGKRVNAGVPMIVKKSIDTSKPVEDVLKFLEELIADAIEKKPAAELQADMIAGIPLLSELGQIGPDYAANPEAVENTAMLSGLELVKRLIQSLKSRAATATPGK